MADIFDGYRLVEAWDEMFAAPGKPRACLRRAGLGAAADGPGRAAVPGRSARPGVHRPRGHLRLRGRGAAVPARPDTAGHRRARVGPGQPGRPAAGEGARGVPRRRLRAGEGVRRRRGPVEPGLHQREVSPRGGRHHAAERRPGARGRHRPDPRRAGQVPGARGQRAGAERRQLRHREPAGDDQDLPRALRRPADPPRRGVPDQAAQRPQSGRPARRGRPVRGRAHPRRAQRRLLRAHPARPADGDRAGRGARPVLLAQPGVRAHHPRPAPGRRHLPAGRRRLARPAALPPRLRPRLPRPAQRGQARHRDGRQRRRQRRRRRQADLYLYAGPDPLLPGRGADPRERGVVPPGRPRGPRLGPAQRREPGAEAGRRGRRGRHRHRPGRHRRGDSRGQGPGQGQPPGLDGAAPGRPVHLPGADRREAQPPPHRPAPVRRQRRERRLGPARRPDAGGAAGGRAQGELQPGRRLQGHLGARRHGPFGRNPEEPGRARSPATHPRQRTGAGGRPRQSGPEQ